MTRTRVLIVGGGIGGLCLAHGLRGAGIPVEVAERTTNRTDWLQGYRIHIDPHGSAALHACLPAENWARFCATVSDEAATFSFRTERLAPLLVVDDPDGGVTDPARRHHGISRIALREALLHGLGETVRFGRTFERYESLPGGGVRAHFGDGTSTKADLLVGADGANSRVRAQLLPHARRADTGVIAIAGKHRLTGDDPLPDVLLSGPTTVLPARAGSMFTAVWRGDRQNAAAGPPADFLFDTTSDYVFWAYADAAGAFPPYDELVALTGQARAGIVGARITGWAPGLRQLVAGSEPETVRALRIRSAEPVEPWPTGPVTLLGDAIHNMTPMAGIGANTALRDADLLRRRLITVRDGEAPQDVAVAGYERQMLGYGFAAVATSLRNARAAASGNRAARLAFRTVLRVADGVPALKRRMFAG